MTDRPILRRRTVQAHGPRCLCTKCTWARLKARKFTTEPAPPKDPALTHQPFVALLSDKTPEGLEVQRVALIGAAVEQATAPLLARIRAVREVLADDGCDCDPCSCGLEAHADDCEVDVCLSCRIDLALRGES